MDLRDLHFADASVMVDLALLARRLRLRGRTLQLRAPQPQVHALIELVGLHRQPAVAVESPQPAVAPLRVAPARG